MNENTAFVLTVLIATIGINVYHWIDGKYFLEDDEDKE